MTPNAYPVAPSCRKIVDVFSPFLVRSSMGRNGSHSLSARRNPRWRNGELLGRYVLRWPCPRPGRVDVLPRRPARRVAGCRRDAQVDPLGKGAARCLPSVVSTASIARKRACGQTQSAGAAMGKRRPEPSRVRCLTGRFADAQMQLGFPVSEWRGHERTGERTSISTGVVSRQTRATPVGPASRSSEVCSQSSRPGC